MGVSDQIDTKPATDISQRALQLARAIDRLPIGQYMILLDKPELEAASWKVEIDRLDHIQRMAISKNYLPE